MNKSPYVYDKAKYHYETIEGHGLSEEHAYNHTTFFMSWLIQNKMMSDFFNKESDGQVDNYLQNKISINKLYEWWDCCLISDLLNEEGNEFAKYYFDFEKGSF